MGFMDMFKQNYESINVNDIYDVKGANIIDVRTKDEYKQHHLVGSKNIPLDNILADKFNLDKNKKYYLVCQSGARSGMACNILQSKGYDVVNLKGGMSSHNR